VCHVDVLGLFVFQKFCAPIYNVYSSTVVSNNQLEQRKNCGSDGHEFFEFSLKMENKKNEARGVFRGRSERRTAIIRKDKDI
jgi:hypothetical protein